MNSRHPHHLKYFSSQSHFPACQKRLFLLQTKTETARAPFQGGEVFAFTSLFERWFLSTDSQAGDFLLRFVGGSHDPSPCGVDLAEPLNTGFDKIMEMRELENIA
jgi:hypothetical protein